MNALLLKNNQGALGLAFVDEPRKVRRINYFSLENNLHIEFSNGDEETLETDIGAEFNRALYARKEVSIAHFAKDALAGDPVDEYNVPLIF